MLLNLILLLWHIFGMITNNLTDGFQGKPRVIMYITSSSVCVVVVS